MDKQGRVRLFGIVAMLVALLPAAALIATSWFQAVREVEREQDLIAASAVRRVDGLVGHARTALRKVATDSQGRCGEGGLQALRSAAASDPSFRQSAILIDGETACTSDGMAPRADPTRKDLSPRPGTPGDVTVSAPAPSPDRAAAMIVGYQIDEHARATLRISPDVLNEFSDFMAPGERAGLFVVGGDLAPIAAVGRIGADDLPPLTAGSRGILAGRGGIFSVARSGTYPYTVVAGAIDHSLLRQWRGNAIAFGLVSVLASVLLVGWVRRYSRKATAIDAELKRAIETSTLEVFYQPVIDLRDGRCVGAEALLRWPRPGEGMVPPALFIAIAEQSRLIFPLTAWLMNRIASDLGDTYRAYPHLHVGINLYPSLFSDDWLLKAAREAFENQIPFHQLLFEITENGMQGGEDGSIQRVMHTLRERGARLAVDDFGIGYSSLSYLRRFEVDYLKIDKAFVDGIESETESSGLIDQVIAIAKNLGLQIIAEGVERKVQADFLQRMGVMLAQGWHFAEPMPARKYIEFVSENSLHYAQADTVR